MRIAPPERRAALYAIYAWMRVADDLADDWASDQARDQAKAGPIAPADPAQALRAWWDATFSGSPAPVAGDGAAALPAVAWAVERFAIDRAWLRDMLDGLLADTAHRQPETWAELERYCYQVGGTVGLCCAAIFGPAPGVQRAKLWRWAIDRGIAFQLVNILRDLGDDAHASPPRCYVPAEVLAHHQLPKQWLLRWANPVACERVAQELIARARAHFASSAPLDASIDPSCRRVLAAMTGTYTALLEVLAANPRLCVRVPRVSLGAGRKAMLALASVLRAGADAAPAPAPPEALRTPEPAMPAPRRPLRHVVVAGGGIAGIACALALCDRGVRVTLLESRRRLGGRASSFTDATTGELLDNGQHVTMGCCRAYLGLLDRLGMSHTVRWFDEQWWVEPGGRVTLLAPGRVLGTTLPGPLANAGSFARARFLSLAERAAVASGLSRLLLQDRAAWVGASFQQWLEVHEQPARAIERFWQPVVVSACNARPTDCAASAAMHVFQDGLAGGADAARIGVSRVPLASLYDRVGELLSLSGGRLLLGETVEQLRPTSVRTRTATIEGDAVVCALPFEKLARVVPEGLRAIDPRFAVVERARHSPIVCVHAELARGAVPVPHAVLLDRPSQWVFGKDHPAMASADAPAHARAAGGATRLSIVISAADDVADLTDADFARLIEDDLRACFPSAGIALARARAVRERLATFIPTPAFERVRPAATGPSGIILAGDYTATGWPATMEGAARSGLLAASCLGVATDIRT